ADSHTAFAAARCSPALHFVLHVARYWSASSAILLMILSRVDWFLPILQVCFFSVTSDFPAVTHSFNYQWREV
ncbi:MAG: hypothetical protein Q7J31_07355, partial [Syntrophales bacterium]|nr:hypothetical protein [Syntrophales bacterium]